jgi:hypothetical protein
MRSGDRADGVRSFFLLTACEDQDYLFKRFFFYKKELTGASASPGLPLLDAWKCEVFLIGPTPLRLEGTEAVGRGRGVAFASDGIFRGEHPFQERSVRKPWISFLLWKGPFCGWPS